MKKIIFIALSFILSAGIVSAQDMATATETYNSAAGAVSMGDYQSAFAYFQQALEMGEACGEEGAELVANCKSYIPQVMLEIGKDYIQAKDYAKAIEQLAATVAKAEEYSNPDVAASASELIPQVYMQQGNDLLKVKDFAGAAGSYQNAVDADTTNGMASLRLGMALASAGDIAGAEAAYNAAIRHGQQSNAVKQLSNMYLKLAAASLKAKKYEDAVAYALAANEYMQNATSMKIAGTASAQLQKNTDAIAYLEQYTLLAPNARDVDDMYYTIAVLAQQGGDNAKACGYYQKLTGNAKYGETAKQQITALKCN